MIFGGDDRAVTVQIGAVLLLGFLVISLSLYQATVVPNENRQIEFQHNQRVQTDMLGVRNAILGTAATGSAAPATVELGTQYPTRTVAVNPAPPSGTLSTSELGTIQVRNATADDATTADEDYPETADFWNGTTKNYTTKALEYRPSYANYDGAPTTVYENGVVYNRFRSGNVTRSGQPVVAGTRISLVALSGNLSRGGASSLLVDPQPMSVSTRTISVTNNSTGENVSVVIPSELDRNEWRGLLNETGDYDANADPTNGAYVYEVQNHSAGVELYFEADETYQLKLSKIGVGSSVEDTDPAYLTSAEDLTEDPFVNRTYPFVVESRDKYNNPVGTGVEAAAERGTIPDGVVVEPGRYRYRYFAPGSSGSDTVRATYRTGSGDPAYDIGSASFEGGRVENVEYDVNVQASGGDDGTGGTGNAAEIEFDGGIQANDGRFRFDVVNTGSIDIEVVRFGAGGSLVDTLDNGNNLEFRLNDGEANDGSPYDADGTIYPLDVNENATLRSGDSRDLRLEGLESGGTAVDRADLESLEYTPGSSTSEAALYVTVETSDGGQKTFYFE